MNIIINERNTGKTKQLLMTAQNTENSAILTQDKRALEVKAKSYGIENVEIFDYDDLENDNIPLYTYLYIHDVTYLLEYLMNRYYGLKVGGFSATLEENE